MSQISVDVVQVLEAAVSCFYIQQLLLLYAISTGKVTAWVCVCVCGGPSAGRWIRNKTVKMRFLSLKRHLQVVFYGDIRRQEVSDADMKQRSRKSCPAVEHLEDLRWKKKQWQEEEKAPGVKSQRGKLVAWVGHRGAGGFT